MGFLLQKKEAISDNKRREEKKEEGTITRTG